VRRLIAPASAAAIALVLVACSPDAKDFQQEAEKYIETREFSEDAGLLRFTDVECQEPADTEEDTRFQCEGTSEDGSRWLFNVQITGDTELQVLVPPTSQLSAPTETVDATTTTAPTGTQPTGS
jgi:hypothetical protein